MNTLKRLRQGKGVLQKEVASYLGVDRTTYVKYERGDSEPNHDILSKLADYFNVSIDYLLGRVDNNIMPVSLDRDIVRIPVLGRIPAGLPIEAIEDILDYIDIPESWTNGGKNFFALEIKGDSMYPEYLTGDIVVFEQSETCETNDDCAVMINGDDATFKRIERKENGIMVKPLNPDYETMFFTNDEIENKPVRIIGIARELRRKK